MTPRLPAGIEASALIRQVGAQGGFGMVVAKGEPDAGTLMVVLCHNGRDSRAYERMPSPDGERVWQISRRADPEKPEDFAEWLARRQRQDSDLWIIELDIAGGERFIGLSDPTG